MNPALTEDHVEQTMLSWLESEGFSVLNGLDIAPGEPASERASYDSVLLEDRLESAISFHNPKIPTEALDQAKRKVVAASLATSNLLENNNRFHQLLTNGIDVEYPAPEGRSVHEKVWLIDFAHPDRNEWLAVNQFTVVENRNNRRPDVVLFVNGIPLGVIELKSPSDHNATIKKAFNQLQTYKKEIPSLFTYNALLVVSDGMEARCGSLTSDWDRFLPWKTIDGTKQSESNQPQLETLVRGIFNKERLLDLIQNFVVFEVDGSEIAKKIAAYHQFHAVNKAIECTIQACSQKGDRRVGVVWHTQGSGKSLSMVYYTGKVVKHPKMENPTVLVLNDRNDLDDQLLARSPPQRTFCGKILFRLAIVIIFASF